MRIIFLNTWHASLKKEFFDFVLKHVTDTDIFCFQEIPVSLQTELQKTLNSFSSIFEVGFMFSDVKELGGQSIFFNNNLELVKSKKILLHELKTEDIGFLLKAEFKFSNKIFLLGNVHGTATPGDKTDSEPRLDQSQIIIDSFKDDIQYKIIGGDFNLLRNTKSIQILEDGDYKNLIKNFKIKATRNHIAWDRFKDDKDFVKQYDSDYVFVSPEIKVTSFEVPNVEVSDHLPLILDFSLDSFDQTRDKSARD